MNRVLALALDFNQKHGAWTTVDAYSNSWHLLVVIEDPDFTQKKRSMTKER